MSRPKVVHFTSVHSADDIRIFHKECRTLAAAGFDVVLLATGEADGGDGEVRIRCVPRPRGRWQRMTAVLYRLYRAALAERADCYHFHDSELLPVGLLLKLRGKRVVYDVHEDTPLQVLSKHWIPRALRPAVSWLVRQVESFCARRLDGLVAATPAIARKFTGAGFPPCVTVQNFPLAVRTTAPARPLAEREPLVICVGLLARTRGVQEMVTAMGMLPADLRARLVLAGNFAPPELEEGLRALPGWGRVTYLGWVNRPQVQALLSQARVGLTLCYPEPNYVESYSTKAFEYMQAGIPMVASDLPLWRSVLGESGAALLVNPRDPAAVADAIQYLLERPEVAEAMGQAGRRAVAERFNWDREAERLLAFYRRLLSPGSAELQVGRSAEC